MQPALGRTIGRYKVEEELGRGGMGVVFRAVDPLIGRRVALKTVNLTSLPEFDDATLVHQRLLREMRLAGSVSHPNIVSVYDVGVQDSTAYIVMEFVDGRSLEKVIAAGGPLDIEVACGLLRQVAAALDYLHARGIVHRDLKPANILLNGAGVAKLTDFGIAKALSDPALTRAGFLLGTPHYMSPEQLTGQPVTGRADQFALAVIAWQLLTSQRPFTGEDLASLADEIVHRDPQPLRGSRCVHPKAEKALRRALSKDPNWRYPTCNAFVEALSQSIEAASSRSSSRYAWIAAGVCLCIAAMTWFFAPRPPAPSASRLPRTVAPAPQQPPAAPVAVTRSRDIVPRQADPDIAAHQRDRLTSQPVLVRLGSDPAGAKLTVDHDPALSCTTPCLLSLAAGRHTASATLPGFRPALKNFNLPSEPVLFVTLQPQGATLMIGTVPSGATILIGGRLRPETTPAVLSLPPGEHTVELIRKDGARVVSRVTLNDGDTKILDANLGGREPSPTAERPPRN